MSTKNRPKDSKQTGHSRARGNRYPNRYIRDRVRALMADPEMTQTEIARRLGVSLPTAGYHWHRILAEEGRPRPIPIAESQPVLSVPAARARVVSAALRWKEQRDQRVAYGLRDIELDRVVTELVDAMRWAEEERSRREAGSA